MAPWPEKNSRKHPSQGLAPLTQKRDKKLLKRWSLGLTTVFVTVITGGLIWRSNAPWQSAKRDLSRYTVKAESGKLPGLITASGELKAQRTVNVSPDRKGLLQDLFVGEGDEVKEGQVLAKMDGGDYHYRLKELKAQYETQQAAFERRKGLFRQGAISTEEKDEFRNRFLTSKARLQQLEIEGDELLVKAPFSGLITARYAEPGAFVTPTTSSSTSAGSTSTSILELSQGLEIAAKVPESDIGRIRIDQNANVRVDAFPDQRFKASVSEISPRAQKTDNVISFEVTLSLMNQPKRLRIGMTADVEFQTGETNISTLVPTVAIVTENGKPGVLLVDQNDQPRYQSVELGTSSGSKTAILKGVNPGNQIFIDLPPWAKRKRD